jgi:Domain of unknown function (DUF4410)
MQTNSLAMALRMTGISALVVCLLTGCGSAKVTGEHSYATLPPVKPVVIYVSNFELEAQNVKREEGLVDGILHRDSDDGILSGIRHRRSPGPEERARQLVDLMAKSLVQDLAKAGFSAIRLLPGSAVPTQGWLVRGVFTEVQEGNRIRRTMIGFGAGATDIQVVTDINDLSKGPPKPLYEIDTDATSGKGPGAAPSLLLGPYGAIARYAMSRKDLDKNVQQTARKIAEDITKRFQPPSPPTKTN